MCWALLNNTVHTSRRPELKLDVLIAELILIFFGVRLLRQIKDLGLIILVHKMIKIAQRAFLAQSVRPFFFDRIDLAGKEAFGGWILLLQWQFPALSRWIHSSDSLPGIVEVYWTFLCCHPLAGLNSLISTALDMWHLQRLCIYVLTCFHSIQFSSLRILR